MARRPTPLTVLAAASLAAWCAVLAHPARPWDLRPRDDETAPPPPDRWPAVGVIVPARNEAAMLERTLPALAAQDYPGPWRVAVVDDRSDDGTAEAARRIAARSPAAAPLEVVPGAPLPAGWVGKVWALEQGRRHHTAAPGAPVGAAASANWRDRVAWVGAPLGAAASANWRAGAGGTAQEWPAGGPEYLLLTDADIHHDPGTLRGLVAEAQERDLALTSRMALLNCETGAERLLIPPFVLFFNLLYPMRWANRAGGRVAAAAGGCVLVRRDALDGAGGFAAMSDALIDDLTLAGRLKRRGGGIRLSVSNGAVRSLRRYATTGPIWRMVRRSAYTQLRRSPVLLAGTAAGLSLMFVAPPAALVAGLVGAARGRPAARWAPPAALGAAAWATSAVAAAPATHLYRLPRRWSWALPAAGALYGAMTVDSALRGPRPGSGGWR